jgi:hypothetical protein
MREIAAAATFDDMRTDRFDPTRRGFEHTQDPPMLAPLSFDDRYLQSLAGETAVDENDSSILTTSESHATGHEAFNIDEDGTVGQSIGRSIRSGNVGHRCSVGG